MTEYDNLKQELKSLKIKTLNRIVPFGKYKGKTIQYIRDCNRDYLYWLLRETNINIDPELLGFDNPTPGVIYSLLKLSYDHNKDKFIYKEVHPAIYDNWNVGHYGCTEALCIKKETIECREYSYEDILSPRCGFIQKLKGYYPYIKWTKEYLKKLYTNN